MTTAKKIKEKSRLDGLGILGTFCGQFFFSCFSQKMVGLDTQCFLSYLQCIFIHHLILTLPPLPIEVQSAKKGYTPLLHKPYVNRVPMT